jgi:FtsH-binding integral membrane protein
MINILISVVCILIASTIVAYATWLLLHRLRKGKSKYKSFKDWIKHVMEAVLGL